jgi:thiol-disulfide isomerase/thioredoxin
MNKILALVLASTVMFSSCSEQKEDVVARITKDLASHNSMYFKVTKKAYFVNGLDTLVTPFETWAVRDKADSNKKGYVWVNDYYRPYHMIYDKGSFFLAIPPKKVTVEYTKFNEPFISDVDWIDYFLKSNSLKNLLSDQKNKTLISDVEYEGKQCVKIAVNLPKTKKGVETVLDFVVDKTTLSPVYAMVQYSLKDEVRIEELTFSDFEFDKVNLEELKSKQEEVLAENPIERNGSHSETARLEKMLHIGDKAPLFSGKDYKTVEDFNLSDYIGKNVIIVDFWYTHCPPCVRSMPHLSELQEKYGSKGLKIFGLNSVDNQPRSLHNLDVFLGKRNLSYDVILTQPEVDIKYKISGYPTMYVIGKDGKIAFVEVGFDKEKLETLTKVIEELTK